MQPVLEHSLLYFPHAFPGTALIVPNPARLFFVILNPSQ